MKILFEIAAFQETSQQNTFSRTKASSISIASGWSVLLINHYTVDIYIVPFNKHSFYNKIIEGEKFLCVLS